MTLSTQFTTMLAMVGMGIVFGITLDTYNRFLNRSRRKRWIVFIYDILFWIVQGLAIFYILFLVNRGEIRFYIFLALLCGFATYQSLLKRMYIRFLELIISAVIAIYRFFLKMLYYLIYKPVYSLIFFLVSLIILLGRGLFSLFKFLLKTVLWIIRIAFSPFRWIIVIIWGLLPKGLKKSVEKLYNKFAGFSNKIKNYFYQLTIKWKKDKK